MFRKCQVFCSMLAGIAAVIEIRYSIDLNHLDWSEKWSWAASQNHPELEAARLVRKGSFSQYFGACKKCSSTIRQRCKQFNKDEG
ncbi:hypothetical protein ANCDUO_07715 [Ancylostoma duodenale]|uniref:Uncharacterized protein n=1 Tax=Ancylostoma duodenale TaxID=51022 RepID=A0A0C2GLA5_9BILA|nr:hypothetical protein ANCDUO_07715 [Ancylostoma duodenale]